MLGKAENTVRAELEGAKENINIEEIIPHKSFEGNRPSNSFLFKELKKHLLYLCYHIKYS